MLLHDEHAGIIWPWSMCPYIIQAGIIHKVAATPMRLQSVCDIIIPLHTTDASQSWYVAAATKLVHASNLVTAEITQSFASCAGVQCLFLRSCRMPDIRHVYAGIHS